MRVARNLVGLTASLMAACATASGAFAQDTGVTLPAPTAGLLPSGAAPAADSPAAEAPRPLSEGVAAVVNDEVISTYDLRQRSLLLLISSGAQANAQNLPQVEREALRTLVDERLEMQEIRRIQGKQKIKLEPTDKEVDAEVASLAKQNGLTSDRMLGTFKAAGVDPDTLREQLRAEQAWRRYMGGRFGSEIRITDNQINSALRRLNQASEKTQYLLSEVLIDPAKTGGQQQAVDGANQLVTQMKQGAPFSAVARQFSALPTAANGGDAGWVNAAALPDAIRDAVEQMRPGQMSTPIAASDGVYIVLLRDERAGVGATVVGLKQAAVSLPAGASPVEVEQARVELDGLRERVRSCASLDKVAVKSPGVVVGDLGETDVKDLSPQFRSAVETLKVGQVTAPLRTPAGLHMLALCSRHAGGDKQPTHDEIENQLYGQQLSMIARRFLRDLRNSATIESR